MYGLPKHVREVPMLLSVHPRVPSIVCGFVILKLSPHLGV